ncbi:MAG TPA: DUF362 domain-containing protein [Candidatus Acidoferrum sp.]|nr:DUF362 domain-containing protein [Candidatus Acidoferrum sp.]
MIHRGHVFSQRLVPQAELVPIWVYEGVCVGLILDQFAQELAVWQQKYAGKPRDELIGLCLMALEREELVTVGYREELMTKRLADMPLSEPVRDLISHALIWAWRDEEMHTIYIRGALLKLGSPILQMKTFGQQFGGMLGGWAGSVRQHVPWASAPVSRAAATVVTWLGALTGKVPEDVRKYLNYGPFRDFCEFNVDAEKTASLCYDRMITLAQQTPELGRDLAEDFVRVRDDEARHARIFEILTESLDVENRLVAGVTDEILAAKIADVGEYFLPRSLRRKIVTHSRIGSGGRVWAFLGESREEKCSLFRRLLDESGLDQKLKERAAQSGKSAGELRVVIKPSFMLGYHTKDRSIITDPQLLRELAAHLRERGYRHAVLVESANIYDQFYGHRGVPEVAAYFGMNETGLPIVDASKDQVPHTYFRGMAQNTISKTWKEADFRISFGKMRSHPIEMAYLTIGNLEWMGGRCDEFLFVERQAHRETALMMLMDAFPPDFALLDAYEEASDGLVGIMGCPRPRSPKRIYASEDALALDLVAAGHIGVRKPNRCIILRAACHWFGDPSGRLEVIGTDRPLGEWRGPYDTEFSTMLSFLAYPVYVFGSGRGSLFVPEMDERAFPPLERETFARGILRRGLRRLLGLHFPRTTSAAPPPAAVP